MRNIFPPILLQFMVVGLRGRDGVFVQSVVILASKLVLESVQDQNQNTEEGNATEKMSLRLNVTPWLVQVSRNVS